MNLDPLLNFTDKVVLITGAASGFGKGLAQAMAKRGAKLVLGDINTQSLDTFVAELKTHDAVVSSLAGDVSNENYASALASLAMENYGGLDIAVNNAGIAPPDNYAIIDTDESVMDKQYQVNTKGVFFGLKHQIPAMLKRGRGSILNVSSIAGIAAAKNLSAYSASKHAVVGLTRTAAVEFGRKNICINAVCPFFSLTPLALNAALASGIEVDVLVKNLANRTPIGRLADPEEVINVMLLLCSPANTYMNGQIIAIDGGISAL